VSNNYLKAFTLINGFGSSQPLVHVRKISLMLNTMWSRRLLRNSNFSPGNRGFFSHPSSVPSQNHDLELNLARLLGSCATSELGLRLLGNISALLNGKSLPPAICHLEHKHRSVASGLTSTCPACSPVPDVFRPSAVLSSNPLGHPLLRQMLCLHSQGLLQMFPLFWITVKTEGC